MVIIDPAFIGDVVFDGPLVRALHRGHPGVRIGLVVRPPADAVARRMVGVERVHVFDKRGADRGLRGLRKLSKELASSHYDVALVPHPSVRTALLARLARIPIRVGNAGGPARLLLTHPRPRDPAASHVGARLELAAALAFIRRVEIPPTTYSDTRSLAATLTPRRHRADRGGPRLALALGANWATKRWPVERAADLVRALDPAITVVLVGSEPERALGDALRSLVGPARPLQDAYGGTLDDLLGHLASCDLVVGGDTGPVHAARALGLPAVLLFGPTPESAHDFGPSDRVLTVPLDCRPCDAHGPARCPLGHHRCLHDLDADRVLTAISALLSEPTSGVGSLR